MRYRMFRYVWKNDWKKMVSNPIQSVQLTHAKWKCLWELSSSWQMRNVHRYLRLMKKRQEESQTRFKSYDTAGIVIGCSYMRALDSGPHHIHHRLSFQMKTLKFIGHSEVVSCFWIQSWYFFYTTILENVKTNKLWRSQS